MFIGSLVHDDDSCLNGDVGEGELIVGVAVTVWHEEDGWFLKDKDGSWWSVYDVMEVTDAKPVEK